MSKQAERDKLAQLLVEHIELYQASVNEAWVHAWFMQVKHDRCTVEEALIGCIVQLSKDKAALLKQVVDNEMAKVPPPLEIFRQRPRTSKLVGKFMGGDLLIDYGMHHDRERLTANAIKRLKDIFHPPEEQTP